MNVVPREKPANNKIQARNRKAFLIKDTTLGIRGPSVLPVASYNTLKVSRPTNNTPRYQFNNEEPTTSKNNSMGPPMGVPLSTKRRFLPNSNSSTKPESSSSGKPHPRVLANDSVADNSDFCTPRNRPTALRYISSSSRGGHSGARSARSTSTSAVEPSVILAISEGRGMARGEVGIAAVDLKHPHLVLCQFSDTLLYVHTLTKINYFNPVEIIVPHTFCEGVQPNQLYKLIKDHYPLVNLTTVQRRHFNDAAGRQQIQTLCAPQYSAVYLQVLHKFYALTAAAAVLKYVEYIQCIVFARESLKIEYHSSEHTMIIDVGTATQLELVQPLVPSAGSTCCLLGVLGPTSTVGGIRALRAAILQPSCKKEFIEERLDAVQDLIANENGLITALQYVIRKLADVDKILLLCMDTQNQNMDKVGEAQLNQTLLLKTTMDVVPQLVEALSGAESGRLRAIKIDFENPDYKEIADRIRNIIQQDAHLEKGAQGSLQRCFAVKPDINGLLDVARRTYSELIEDIQKIVEQLSEVYDLPIRLNQNMMKGFHMVMPVAPKQRRHFSVEDLPPIFIQVQYNGASVTMTTEELVVLDQQAKESLNEIQKMSNIVISGLLKELRPFMSSLYKLCEDVAELDILLALAQATSIGSYIRPDFNTYMDIRNGVHPLLDYNSQVMPVPNDIFASPEYNFTIITGPNMGGKSIYIKQIALMQIMAQLGCYLPATNAVLRLCDRIFSRIGFNDSVELNASTYVFEMKEMQHIMTGLTSSSLVIIDELCRGTCAEEGTSMAWSICEELLLTEAFTFFTTHFIYLTRLQDLYFNVVNRHTVVTEEEIADTQSNSNPQERLVYQHKIEPGTTKVERYGLALAAKTNLPENTVKLAMELAELISQTKKPQEIDTPQSNDEALLYKLNAELRQEYRKHPNSGNVKKIIRKFKEEHSQLIERIRQRDRSNIRIDSSANYSDDNSRRQTSLTKQNKIECSNTNISFYEQIQRSSALRTPPRVKPVIICNASDVDSDNLNGHNTFSAQSPEEIRSNTDKNKNLRSKVVYSTSADDAGNGHTNERNYTSVKSSNELLTSVMNIDNDDLINETQDDKDSSNNISNNDIACISIETRNIEAKSFANDCNKNISNINGNDNSNPDEENDIDLIDVSSESDIAEALTQFLGSVEESNMDKTIDDTSIDEELVRETVNEINEDLARQISIGSIILTPPMDFRD